MHINKSNCKTIMMVITDAISFNILCAGQLEYLSRNRRVRLVLACGGDRKEIEKLKQRKVGDVIFLRNLTRKPNLIQDLFAFMQLTLEVCRVKPDLIIYSTPKALFLCALASLIVGVRTRIALVRGRVYENFDGLQRKVYSFFDFICLRVSTRAVFISESLRNAYVKEGLVSLAHADVIGAGSSNGVDINHYRPPTADERQRCRLALGLNDSEFAIVSIGRFCTDKGAREFYETARHLGYPFKLFWVGPIEDSSLREQLDNSANNEGNVTHVGRVDDIRPFLWAADAHLFLTHREGFGNVAIEAAACNLQTVAFDVVGVQDSVSSLISGIRVPFADVPNVVDALQVLRERRLNHQDYSVARDWVKINFDQNLVWSKLEEYIEGQISEE